ncbi:MAG TPA: PAS domain S-box protein, partial [Azonexus sp.]|nr:PAS domain S-box protein [Azonexus sp.]
MTDAPPPLPVEPPGNDSERHFRALFAHAMVGMARSSADKRWIEVNPALAAMLGYTPEEMVGRTWSEMTHPDDLASDEERFAAVIRGEIDGYALEKRFLRRNGSVVHTQISARGIRNPAGVIDCFAVVIEDMTQHHETERALAQQVKRAAVLLELPFKAEALSEAEFMKYALEQAEALTGSSIGFMHFVNEDGESIELV